MGEPNFWLTSPDGTSYTNIFSPDFPMPPVGGAAAFPSGKKKVVGLGSSRHSAPPAPPTALMV